ncbi:hypothetical protein C7E18_24330, partial [Stenotrophomonas maltophilia]
LRGDIAALQHGVRIRIEAMFTTRAMIGRHRRWPSSQTLRGDIAALQHGVRIRIEAMFTTRAMIGRHRRWP